MYPFYKPLSSKQLSIWRTSRHHYEFYLSSLHCGTSFIDRTSDWIQSVVNLKLQPWKSGLFCISLSLLFDHERGIVMKLGKHQRSKRKCQDLCLKIHAIISLVHYGWYTMHELNNYCVLCPVKPNKKRKKKTYNKELFKFHNHSSLLTMVCLSPILN